jgi:hypothetical protein
MLSDLLPALPPGGWTAEKEQALAELVSQPPSSLRTMGSLELVERLGKPVTLKVSPPEQAAPGMEEIPINISSPLPAQAAQPGRKGFWLNVNAELVIYGATEPDASVTIGGRLIRLRQDGTFSYRFALPDGTYSLPIAAISRNDETRQVELGFSRWTVYGGEVGAHAQDPALRPPSAEGLV